MSPNVYNSHLNDYKSLITPHSEIRAGFISIALEKNLRATPFIEEAKALKIFAEKAASPSELLNIKAIQVSLLTAAGISEKANNHFNDEDRKEAVKRLIEGFLEPAGKDFTDELVYRFLLTRGDSLGGAMRNLAGKLGERKFKRALISTASIKGIQLFATRSQSKKWEKLDKTEFGIEDTLRGLGWKNNNGYRCLMFNLTVPVVNKNVDICLFNRKYPDLVQGKCKIAYHRDPSVYIALGELKGGIDPAGADEHWKTANSALERIRERFQSVKYSPYTFFVGATIENSMAKEIYGQLLNGKLKNAANLTSEKQLISVCNWILNI